MNNNYKDLYDVLEIPADSDVEEIKLSYRKLARLYHPDSGSKADNERFFEIQSAWEILSDNSKRSSYDKIRNENSWKMYNKEVKTVDQTASKLQKRASSLHGYGVAKPVDNSKGDNSWSYPDSKENKNTFLDKLKKFSKDKK